MVKRTCLIVASAMMLSGVQALAGPREDEAAKLSAAAESLFEVGRYQEALKLFLDARSRFDPGRPVIPTVIYNIGRCYQELGDFQSALQYFEEFEKHADTPEFKQAVAKRLSEVRARLVAYLTLVVEPTGADIAVNGTRIGSSPLDGRMPVRPGRLVVRVSKLGFRTGEKQIDIKAGESRTMELKLEQAFGEVEVRPEGGDVGEAAVRVDGHESYRGRLPAILKVPVGEVVVRATAKDAVAAVERLVEVREGGRVTLTLKARPPAPAPVVAAPTKDVPRTNLTVVRPPAPPAGTSTLKAVLFWGGLGTAVVGAGLHLWGGLEWKKVQDGWKGEHTYSDVKSTYNASRSKTIAAYALYGVAGAAVVTSFLVGDGKHPLGFGAAPLPGGLAVSGGWRW